MSQLSQLHCTCNSFTRQLVVSNRFKSLQKNSCKTTNLDRTATQFSEWETGNINNGNLT